MRSRTLIAGVVAASLLVSGCAHSDSDDVAGALLLGAAVVGLGLLAAGSSDDDDDDDKHHYRSSGYGHRHGYDDHHRGRHRERSRYAGNGRCDDASYETSNGGRAEAGTDERDCRRYGHGLK